MVKIVCDFCKQKKEGIRKFAESLLDYTHGFTKNICIDCLIKKHKKTIKRLQQEIKELENGNV